jgi:hypothetical protein
VANPPANKTKLASLTHLLLGVFGVLYVWSRFMPGEAVDNASQVGDLDYAWGQVLHWAFATHRQFGTEVVFTYGPWGFLACGYNPKTFWVLETAWVCLSAVFLAASWRLARNFSSNRLMAGLWLVGFAAASSIPVKNDFNVVPAAWGLLLLGLHFLSDGSRTTLIQILLAVTLGWIGLAKFSGLIEGAVVIGAITADNIFRQRRIPWTAAAWVAALLFFWLAAGQHLSSLGPFLLNSWRVAAGYTEAMMLPETAPGNMAGYLILAVLLSILVGKTVWSRCGRFAMLPMAAVAAILFVAFKMGFVRNGWEHECTSAMTLVLVSLVCLAATRRVHFKMVCPSMWLLAATLMFAFSAFGNWTPAKGLGRQFIHSLSPTELFAPVASICTGSLKNEYRQNAARKREKFPAPFPPSQGGTDLYSYEQTLVFAEGLSYAPRPVFQSYSAYTPELARMNAEHLRAAKAATNILFAIQPIDQRFPALEDGYSWLELLARYDLKNSGDAPAKFLWLTRADTPRQFGLEPLNNVAARMGEKVSLPARDHKLIWVEIAIHKSLAGNLVSWLYKPPPLMLEVTLKDHSRRSYRLVPGMAADGFLLSPVIADNESFAALATREGTAPGLANMEVEAIKVLAATPSGVTSCYRQPILYRFYQWEHPLHDEVSHP